MLRPLGFQIIDLFPTNSVFFLFTYIDYSGINLIGTPQQKYALTKWLFQANCEDSCLDLVPWYHTAP